MPETVLRKVTRGGPAFSGRARERFTLTELLVVMAVIMVLCSLLSPALLRSRRQAVQTICLGNVRSLGQGGLSFLMDNGYYPPDCSGGFVWPLVILPYLENSASAFWCPAAPPTAKWNGKPFTTGYSATPFSYSLDCWGAADSSYLGWWVPAGHTAPGRTPQEIADSSDFYWLMDSNHGQSEDTPCQWDLIFEVHVFDWCAPTEWPGSRHLDGTNVLFADGHAQWIRRADIFRAGTSPRGSAERLAWRRKDNFDHQPHEEYGN